MSYCDYGTAMAFKLDRWRVERNQRNFEIEADDCVRRARKRSESRLIYRSSFKQVWLLLAGKFGNSKGKFAGSDKP